MNKILKYQGWHFIFLAILIWALYYTTKQDTIVFSGELWGISSYSWFIIALLSPILHQLYVLITWRYELHYKSISRYFGSKGFTYYKIGFALLILSRPITIILLAISSAHTLNIRSFLVYILTALLLIPSAYLFYSVSKYFGFERAFGSDHFYPEAAKTLPFVKQGIFKYTDNGMYKYGFLILWIPGILFHSKAALLIAFFNHAYIWVHHYFTELPDINIIYGDASVEH